MGFVARRADKGKEFLSSTDNWFRPAQFANGPDGNLYVIDVYREVIEHPLSLPPQIKQHLDLTSGRDRGRIYRIAPMGFRQGPPTRLGQAATAQLVAALESRNGWQRDTAARLLFERQDRKAVEPLSKLAAESKLPQARAQALVSLAGLGALAADQLLPRLADESPRVREQAARLSERLANDSRPLRAKLFELASDPDMRVRYQLAFSLGELKDPGRFAALAAILRRDPGNRWIRLAALSSLAEGAGEVFALLSADTSWRTSDEARGLLGELAQYIGRQNRADEKRKLLAVVESLPDSDSPLAAAIVRGLGQGLARGKQGLAAQLDSPSSSRAQQVLNTMLAKAREDAAADGKPPAARIEAIGILTFGDFQPAQEVLAGLLSNQQPQDVQSAAVHALAAFADAGVAPTLIDAWPSFSPRLRAEVAEVLFSRAIWLSALVAAAEQGKLSLADLEPARLKVLEGHPDASIQKRAAPLLAKTRVGRRQDVVEAYRGALTANGDASRGRAVFAKICAACHRLDGVGHEIGPNLASFRNRGAEAILVNVLDPNREVNPQYVNYVVITHDGRSMTGMVAAETATSVTLKRAEDVTDVVERDNIEQLRSTGQSIMPEGMEKQIDQAAMADLLAYLMGVL